MAGDEMLKWTEQNFFAMLLQVMKRFSSKFGIIELTDERWRHIVQFHPEVARYSGRIASVLKEPEIIVMSRSDSEVLIFYRSVGRLLNLAVVVRIGKPNFVLTSYLRAKTNKQ